MSSLCLPRLFLRSRQVSISVRNLSTTRAVLTSWSPGPSPPRLPKEEQEIFDKLMKQSTGAFSTPTKSPTETVASTRPQINQSPQSTETIKVETGEGEELHPNIRRGAPPEFQGDVNPKTGEVGGPKNEPLRWGHSSDWSYNGRVTDF